MKKILALVLSVIMVMGMIPMMALWTSAEEDEPAVAPGYADLYIHSGMVYEEADDGSQKLTLIGGVSEEVIENAEALQVALTFNTGKTTRTLNARITTVYTTVSGFVTTDMMTAVNGMVLVKGYGAVYAVTVKDIPEEVELVDYTVDVTVTAVGTDYEVGYAKQAITTNVEMPEGYLTDVINFGAIAPLRVDPESGEPVKITSYCEWGGLTCGSGTYFDGMTAADKHSVQMRTNNSNSGIVSSASEYILAGIAFVFNTDTAATRKINIYGSTAEFSSAEDLYKVSKPTAQVSAPLDDAGAVTSEVVLWTPAQGQTFANVGIRSDSGALYLESIVVYWAPQAAMTDDEVLAAELAGLDNLFPETADDGDTVELPQTGALNERVQFVWNVSGAAAISGTTATFTNTDTANDAEATFTLKATLNGKKQTKEFTVAVNKKFVKPTTPEAILAAAFALEKGETLPGGEYTLSGKITVVNTEYNSEYKNVTVTITLSGKSIQCFRMVNGEDIAEGEGVEVIKANDEITVTGTIKNYNGTVEFDSGCKLVSVDEVGQTETEPDLTGLSDKQIVEKAFEYLTVNGKSFTNPCTLTGEVTEIITEYNPKFGNVTVTIKVPGTTDDQKIQCYRLKGNGADAIAVGDTITVNGKLKNYNGTIEFDNGCELVNSEEPVTTETPTPETETPVETEMPVVTDAVTLTFPDGNSANNKKGSYENEWTAKVGTQEWTIANFNNNSWNGWTYIKCGHKNNANAVTATITTTISQKIEKVGIVISNIIADQIDSIKLYIGGTLVGSYKIEASEDVQYLTIPAASQGLNKEYKLEFNTKIVDNGKNGAITLNSVEYVLAD